MMTDTVLIEALSAETLSPLAAELLKRFTADVAARDKHMAALTALDTKFGKLTDAMAASIGVEPVSIETSPRPLA